MINGYFCVFAGRSKNLAPPDVSGPLVPPLVFLIVFPAPAPTISGLQLLSNVVMIQTNGIRHAVLINPPNFVCILISHNYVRAPVTNGPHNFDV